MPYDEQNSALNDSCAVGEKCPVRISKNEAPYL